MKIIKFFKKLFSKPLSLEDRDEHSVISVSHLGGKINLNQKLVVPDNYECIFVAKEKVCDRFTSGTYKLDLNTIPSVCRLLKLNVPNKKGKYKNSFKADIYFINKKDIVDNKFESINGIYIKKSKDFLGLMANFEGTYSYKVIDSMLFVEALLCNFAIIKGGIAQRQIDIWTGLNAERKIEKNNPSVEDINERTTKSFDGLLDYLNRNMKDIGIEYLSVDITKTMLPKNIYRKTQLEVNENVEHKVDEQTDNDVFSSNNPKLESQVKDLEDMSNKVLTTEIISEDRNIFDKKENEKNFDFNEDIKDINDINSVNVIENNEPVENKFEQNYNETYSKQVLDTSDNKVVSCNKSDIDTSDNTNNEDIKEETKKEDEEVESRKIAYKKCPNCESIISKSSSSCFNCGYEFKKVCEKCGAELNDDDFVCPKCKSIVI